MKRWLMIAAGTLAVLSSSCHRETPAFGTSVAERLAHSLSIIRTATRSEPKVLRILFYGQSITSRNWTDRAAAHLSATYPNVRFEVRNLAIGGFSAVQLERTVDRDIVEAYPDLVVFHVYGDHHAYERIIRIIRSRTAADVIVETDHVVEPVEPLCPEGLHLSLARVPGCNGRFWYKQNNWGEHMSGVVIPALAEKYGLVVEPRRREWAAWLRRTGTPATALIADPPHPNDRGWQLMAALFDSWFDRVVGSWRGERGDLVTTLPAPRAAVPTRFSFNGNRIELIGSAPVGDGITARIDGRAPAELDGCWQTSRASALPSVPDWPAVRQVWTDPALHRAERWTATVHGLTPSQDRFGFDLVSSRDGPDGSGVAGSDFTSRTAHTRIAASDWMLPAEHSVKQKIEHNGIEVRWDRHFVCGDQPPVALTAGRREVRHVIATGLVNGPHEVSLILSPAAAAQSHEIRLYRPPLDH